MITACSSTKAPMAYADPANRFPGAPNRGNPTLSGNLLAVGAMVLWAAGFPAAEALLDVWHPITLMLLRLGMAMAVLVPLWILFEGPLAVLHARWGRGIWIGMLGFGSGTNLLLFAQWYTDPVTVALIAAATPICATIIEVFAGARRLSARFVAGLGASVLGGGIAVGGAFSPDVGWGILMAVAAGFFFTWASHAAVRDFPDMSAMGRSTITFAGAGVFTAMIFAAMSWAGEVAIPQVITPKEWGLLAVYAVAAMALSQILFIASVARLGIALSSFHINIAPFYVMLIMIALGGAWDWRAAIGAAIVGIGVLLSQPRQKPQAAARSTE